MSETQAAWIVRILSRIGQALLGGLDSWDGDRTRAEISKIVNDEELKAARRAESKVKSYLDSLEDR